MALLVRPNQICLRIEGAPRGKGRPRAVKTKSGGVRTYTPDETVLVENQIKAAWVQAGRPTISGPVVAVVSMYFARPKSHFNRNGEFSKAGWDARYPCKKPDWDNAAKLLDALNGLAFADDAHIVDGRVVKLWAHETPCMVFTLWGAP